LALTEGIKFKGPIEMPMISESTARNLSQGNFGAFRWGTHVEVEERTVKLSHRRDALVAIWLGFDWLETLCPGAVASSRQRAIQDGNVHGNVDEEEVD
jgi:hypothetical protein